MAYEKRDLSGALFKNDRRTRDTHPEYQGSITIDGKDYWLSAWIKEGAKGKFFSLAAKPKEGATALPPENTGKPVTRNDMADDEIPF